jgi:phospholipid transport system substrate-binding protein
MYRMLIAAFAALATTAALAQEAPDALVKKGVDDVLSAIKNDKDLQAGNLDKVMKLADEKVLPNFDMARMTRLAVGRPWAQATDAQKEALTKEFKTLIIRTYSSSLSQYRNQVVEVKPLKVAAGDTDVVVRTEVKQQGGPSDPAGLQHGEDGARLEGLRRGRGRRVPGHRRTAAPSATSSRRAASTAL